MSGFLPAKPGGAWSHRLWRLRLCAQGPPDSISSELSLGGWDGTRMNWHATLKWYSPEPSIVPFISAPPLVRTWILGSYLKSLFVPFIFCLVCFLWFRAFFWFYPPTGLRFGFKCHILKLVWIGQSRIVSQGPVTPMGPSRSLEPTLGDVREIWGPIRSAKTCKKRAKNPQKSAKGRTFHFRY